MTNIVHAFTLIINSYNATQLNRWVKELFLPGWWHYISNVPAGPLPNSKDAHLKQVNELINSMENQSFCFWWFHSLLFSKLIFVKIAWLPSLAILIITSLPFNQEDFYILRMQQSFHFRYIGINENSKHLLEEKSSFTFLHTIYF